MVTLGASFLAAAGTGEDWLLTFVVFGVSFFLIAYSSLAALFPDPGKGPRHPEDTVESRWLERATAAAFVDLVTAMALALGARYVLGMGDVPLQAFVALGLLDAGGRYLLSRRRER